MVSTSSNRISLNAGDYPVKAVTIFQSSTAQLTRTITVDLVSGRNVLEITGISSRVDTESPRIHGLGQDARVFDISCDVHLANVPGPRIRKNSEKFAEITSELQALERERDVRRTECDTLEVVVKTLSHGQPTDLDTFMDNFIRRVRLAKRGVAECEKQIAALEKELWLLSDATSGETAGRVVATILAKRECTVAFQLTYLVAGVSWTPYYALHATTAEGRPSPEVSLLYCANITQETGEDWDDTILTLSTANSQALRNLSVPILDSLKVSPLPPPQATPAAVAHTYHAVPQATSLTRMASSSRARVATSEREMERETARRVTTATAEDQAELDTSGPPTTVDRNPLSLSYNVEGLVSLPSDGVAHKVSIAMLDFTAELKYVCVPRKNTSAFIEGTLKNTSEYELLAGPVSVFMDEGFVTKTAFNLISVNESFDCVLGIDTALRVTYSQKSHTEHEPARSFAEPTKTTTRTVTTTASNKHTFDIANLVIRDIIPLGNEDANIKVMLRKPDGLALAKDGEEVTVGLTGEVKEGKVRWSKVENGKGGEKEGMYEWVLAVPAGQAVTVEAEWAIKAPSNVKWEETANRADSQKE